MSDYARVKEAIRFLQDNAACQPTLQDVADAVGQSPFHLQRVFRRWAGISPKRFLQFLTVEHAKERLRESASVLETTWDTGLSSPGRLHDLFVAAEAVTPGEYKRGGEGVRIRYGFHATSFGEALVGISERGICALQFCDEGGRDAARERLRSDWPGAELEESSESTTASAEQALSFLRDGGEPPLLHLRGTNFQLKVWRALLEVPAGAAVSYGSLARRVGGSPRAVGNAVGANRIALLIPCHRVLRGDGTMGGYRWGAERKAALVGWESARREASARERSSPKHQNSGKDSLSQLNTSYSSH